MREQLLESRIKQLEASLITFQAQFDPTVRGKGRGKKSAPSTSTATAHKKKNTGIRASRTRPAPSVASDFWTDDESGINEDEEQFFYLKNVELTLNGTLIDQVVKKSIHEVYFYA